MIYNSEMKDFVSLEDNSEVKYYITFHDNSKENITLHSTIIPRSIIT